MVKKLTHEELLAKQITARSTVFLEHGSKYVACSLLICDVT
jgi:hypothetical protein